MEEPAAPAASQSQGLITEPAALPSMIDGGTLTAGAKPAQPSHLISEPHKAPPQTPSE